MPLKFGGSKLVFGGKAKPKAPARPTEPLGSLDGADLVLSEYKPGQVNLGIVWDREMFNSGPSYFSEDKLAWMVTHAIDLATALCDYAVENGAQAPPSLVNAIKAAIEAAEAAKVKIKG